MNAVCPAGHKLNGISAYCQPCESLRRKIRRERTRKPSSNPTPPRTDKHFRTISVYYQSDVVLVLPSDIATLVADLFRAVLASRAMDPDMGRAVKLALTGIEVSQAGEDRFIGRGTLPERASVASLTNFDTQNE